MGHRKTKPVQIGRWMIWPSLFGSGWYRSERFKNYDGKLMKPIWGFSISISPGSHLRGIGIRLQFWRRHWYWVLKPLE